MCDLAGSALDARTGGRMTKLKLVNLLNDFNLGGVTKGLSVYETEQVASIADTATVAIDPDHQWPVHYDADIIITHFPPSWRRLLFFLMLRLRNPNAKIVHVEHSYSKEWAALHVPSAARFGLMLKLACRCFDQIVAVSHAQAAWLAQLSSVPVEKIAVIYPMDSTTGLAHIPDVRFEPGKPLILGAYGRFHEAKNFDTLIRAFNRLRPEHNMRLIIGGYGDGQGELEALAAGNPDISFYGKVTDVADFLSQCQVVVVPSRYECFGCVADEARRAGRPIMVSHAGGLPEQAPGAGICVDCTTEDAIFAGLSQLRKLPLSELGRGGRTVTLDATTKRSQQWADLFAALA